MPVLATPVVVAEPETARVPLRVAAPLAERVVAATGPEIAPVELIVPVLATPLRVAAPLAETVVAAIGPEIAPVDEMVPVLTIPVRAADALAVKVPATLSWADGWVVLMPT